MKVSEDDARESLNTVEEVIARTRKAIESGPASTLLIMWGAIWIIGFLSTYFVPKVTGWVWLILDVFGVAATITISFQSSSRVKSPNDKPIFWFWFLLFAYANVWIVLLGFSNWFRVGAFVSTIPMFAYVVMGLWLDKFFVWLGLIVTGFIVLGFFMFPSHPLFWIWMAVMAGGALFGTGIYIRIAWR